MNKTFPLRGYNPKTSVLLDDDFHTPMQPNIIAYCAEEVRRQQDSPWHVYRMLNAWALAIRLADEGEVLTSMIVRELGKRVDEANEDGFRNGPIWIGGNTKAHHMTVSALIDDLVDRYYVLSPEEFYLEFENVHPFFDGNGRTGKILYNWSRGSLHDPVFPPDFFGGIENP